MGCWPSFCSFVAIIIIGCLSSVCADPVYLPPVLKQRRVCYKGERSQVISSFGKTIPACVPNKLHSGTVRIMSQGWWAAIYTAWVAQIILMEELQIPTKLSHSAGPDLDYYKFDSKRVEMQLTPPISAYDWDGLVNANTDPECTNPSHGFRCFHAMLEGWSGQRAAREAYVIQRRQVEDGGPLGVLGRIGMYISAQALDAHPSLKSYRGLQRPSATAVLLAPQPFGAFCAALRQQQQHPQQGGEPAPSSIYTGSFCEFYHSTMYTTSGGSGGGGSGGAGHPPLVVRPAFAAAAAAYEARFFISALTVGSAEAAALAAHPTAFPKPLFPGNFTAQTTAAATSNSGTNNSSSSSSSNSSSSNSSSSGGAGGVFNGVPCWWTQYSATQIAYGGFALRRRVRTAAHLMEIASASGYSGTPASASPFHPILMFAWSPHEMLDRYKFDGLSYKLERVSLKAHTTACSDARPSARDRCNASLPEAVRLGPPIADCDYPADIVFKSFSRSLRSYSPRGYSLLRNLEITTEDQQTMLSDVNYNPAYANITDLRWRRRAVVADWVRANRYSGRQWQSWISAADVARHCQDDCNGHGNCTAIPGFRIAGQCVCSGGWEGTTCNTCTQFLHKGRCKPLVPASIPATAATAITATAALGLLLSLSLSLLVIRHRAHKVMVNAQRNFLLLSLLGAALSFAACAAMVAPPSTLNCCASLLLAHTGLGLFLAPLYAKTWRVARIFGAAESLKRVVVHEKRLLLRVLAGEAALLLYLLLWLGVSLWGSGTPIVSPRLQETAHNVLQFGVCTFGSSPAWGTALFTVEVLFALWGVQLSYTTRKVRAQFSESRYIAFTIYNLCVVGGFVALLAIATRPFLLFPVLAGGLLFQTLVGLLLLFLPKLLVIYGVMAEPEPPKSSTAASRRSGHSSRSSRGSGRTSRAPAAATSAAAASVVFTPTAVQPLREQELQELLGTLRRNMDVVTLELGARSRRSLELQGNADAVASAVPSAAVVSE